MARHVRLASASRRTAFSTGLPWRNLFSGGVFVFLTLNPFATGLPRRCADRRFHGTALEHFALHTIGERVLCRPFVAPFLPPVSLALSAGLTRRTISIFSLCFCERSGLSFKSGFGSPPFYPDPGLTPDSHRTFVTRASAGSLSATFFGNLLGTQAEGLSSREQAHRQELAPPSACIARACSFVPEDRPHEKVSPPLVNDPFPVLFRWRWIRRRHTLKTWQVLLVNPPICCFLELCNRVHINQGRWSFLGLRSFERLGLPGPL